MQQNFPRAASTPLSQLVQMLASCAYHIGVRLPLLCIFLFAVAVYSSRSPHSKSGSGTASNHTLAGNKLACMHKTWYFVNPNVEFQLCLAQSDNYLKVDGNSVTELIKARTFMPTCRVMHLLLWMYRFFQGEFTSISGPIKEYFVDVGANIGEQYVYHLILWITVAQACRHCELHA
jgi:hypothetical protein